MLPNSVRTHHSPPPPEERSTPTSFIIKSQSGFRLGWFLFAALIQTLLIIFFIHRSRPQLDDLYREFRNKKSETRDFRVFVYNLPETFNKKLLDNCHDLDPWKAMCPAISNGGFGPKANNLDGVLPANITPAWYWTDLYISEVIYHVRMLNYSRRTLNPDKATAFYVPFYAGLAIQKYLFLNYTAKDRDRPCELMLNWLKNQPYWKKHDGADHFMMLGRLTWAFRRVGDHDSAWGTSFANMPLMKNVLKLTVERNPWDQLEFSVPWPTSFHPRSKSDIHQWQRTHHSPPPPEERSTPTSFIIKSQSGFRLGWFLFAALIQTLLIIFFIHRSRPQLDDLYREFRNKKSETRDFRVFVYNLPETFNKKLLDNCHDLDPWKAMCPAISNGGFGPRANNLDGVLPANITPAWYWTDLYISEVIYHVRMLNYSRRTLNPDKATAFYVPFYAGLAIQKYLFLNYTAKDRDRPCELMLNWLKNQPYWKKHDGADHFMMLGRLTWAFRRVGDHDSAWGTSFANMPLMKNVLKLTVERNPWDQLEFSVPWPTSFHPRSKSDIHQWQRYILERNRSSLFTFVGAARKSMKNDFRTLLIDQCKSQSSNGSCKLVDCSVTKCFEGAPEILEAFLDSDFCLQPRGDGYTRRSFLDCMVAGSIPVFFWEKSFKGQYEWHLPSNAESYSAFIDHKDVRNGTVSIKGKLERFSKERVREMRETVVRLLPKFVYAEPSQGLESPKDAFDITMDNVLRKIGELDLRNQRHF